MIGASGSRKETCLTPFINVNKAVCLYICCIAVVHIHMWKHCQHNNDERTQVFRKIYVSHFIRNSWERLRKGYVWEMSWILNKTATYWPPVPLSLAALLSCSAGLLNRGSWGPIVLCWVLVLSTASFLRLDWLQLTELPVAPGYIIVWHPPASCERRICTQLNPSTIKVIPWYLRLDAPVPLLTAVSKVNMLHIMLTTISAGVVECTDYISMKN